jgi:hypothetical protein
MRSLAVAVCFSLFMLPVLLGDSASAAGRRRRAPDTSPKVGEKAVDFELLKLDAFLKKTKDKSKDEVAKIKWEATDKVKLSSFIGKQPVVFVLSSYT